MSLRNAARVDGYILDGFPRVLEQAQMWSDLTLGDGNPELVINISLARSVTSPLLLSMCPSVASRYWYTSWPHDASVGAAVITTTSLIYDMVTMICLQCYLRLRGFAIRVVLALWVITTSVIFCWGLSRFDVMMTRMRSFNTGWIFTSIRKSPC